jgi:hypothetical protein
MDEILSPTSLQRIYYEIDTYIITQIKDTYYILNKYPEFKIKANNGDQFITIMWKVEYNDHSIWDRFESKSYVEAYFEDIKYEFEEEYPNLELGIKIDLLPTIIDDQMYGRIILYYYDKELYQNTNTIFIS